MRSRAVQLEIRQRMSHFADRKFVASADRPWGRGFTLTELMIVVAVIGLLASIAMPNFVRARRATQVRACVANLHRIDDCKAQWALEFRKTDSSIPTVNDIIPYLRANHLPACPASGTYRLRRVSRTPVCSQSFAGHTLNNLNLDDDALPD